MPSYVVTRLMDLLTDAGLAQSWSKVLCLGRPTSPVSRTVASRRPLR